MSASGEWGVFRPAELLAALTRHEVRFVVVGGVAARLHGAPVTTMDVDVLYALDDDNVDRTLAALRDLGAVFRQRPELVPQRSHVASRGHKLLQTNLGRFDLLGHVDPDIEYEQLIERTEPFEIDGVEVRVVDLPTLIELKRACARPRDLAMLPLLEAALAERDA